MIDKFVYKDAYPPRSPMVTSQVLNKERKEREGEEQNEQVIDPTRYREIVGSLFYLSNAMRPDITYTVNVLSRYQLNPTEVEWKMVHRVFKYLIHTKELSLTYKGKQNGIDGYSDSSLADCRNSITTCGYLVRIYGDAIAWRTRKQHYVFLSTCKAEYIAMSDACKEMIGLSLTMKEFSEDKWYSMTLN